MSADDCTLVVLAKAPRPGAVKTRLAAAVGSEGAAKLAHAFLIDTLQGLAAMGRGPVMLATTTAVAEATTLHCCSGVWDQGDGDLGERIERVMARALRSTPCVVVLGGDTPGLPAALLRQAAEVLMAHTADAVLGPSDDGGFYLLGLRRCEPGLLAQLPWSASDTAAKTLARLREKGLRVEVLPPWFDVDEPRDLARLSHLIAKGELDAPETARLLRQALPNPNGFARCV